MLTGRLPFAGDTCVRGWPRWRACPSRRSTSCPCGQTCPRRLVEVVRHCLAQEPGHRPASAAAIAERLRAWLLGSGETISSGAGPLATLQSTRSGPTTPTSGLSAPTVRGAAAALPGPAGHGVPRRGADGRGDRRAVADRRDAGASAAARRPASATPATRAVGTELGAAMVVDATLQVTPTLLRVQARLVEVSTGVQVYNERFEARADDLLDALQEIVSKKIAEGLRLELTTVAHRRTATPEAIALYRRARRKITGGHIIGPDGAIELLEEAAPRRAGVPPGARQLRGRLRPRVVLRRPPAVGARLRSAVALGRGPRARAGPRPRRDPLRPRHAEGPGRRVARRRQGVRQGAASSRRPARTPTSTCRSCSARPGNIEEGGPGPPGTPRSSRACCRPTPTWPASTRLRRDPRRLRRVRGQARAPAALPVPGPDRRARA